MPEFIDLISSDPPVPPKPQLQAPQPAELPSRRPSYNIPISSDPFDTSLFDHDFDKPVKRRRVSEEEPILSHQNAKSQVSKEPKEPAKAWFQISDDEFDLPPQNTSKQKKPTQSRTEESDPITFTSPAPGPLPKLSVRKPNPTNLDILALDDDDDFLDLTKPPPSSLLGRSDIEEFSDPFALPEFAELAAKPPAKPTSSNAIFSESTARLLARLKDEEECKSSHTKAKAVSGRRQQKGSTIEDIAAEFLSDDDLDESPAPRKAPKRASKLDPVEKEAKARAREEAKMQREIERQLEKDRKLKRKEDKAKEKRRAADIASVNKLKINKKDSTPEMIVDMATSFEETSVGTQTVEFMKRLGVQQTFFQSPIPNVVKWRRKLNATFNKTLRHWVPCQPYIQTENHVLCLVPAQDFINMVTPPPDSTERESLEAHVMRLKSAYPNSKPIYLIEGLTALMRKNTNARNRAFQAEVLRQMAEPAPEPETTQKGRKPKKKPDIPLIDDESVEDALLQLQVAHSCLIHHTTAPPDSAEWIKNFTEHISTVPYRRERQEAQTAAFCMDTGQVKTGIDKHDTFIKMIQEVNRVTAPMAYGIAGQYPCVTNLVRGMRIHGAMMLEDIKVCTAWVTISFLEILSDSEYWRPFS
jgi:crossover junction endonuclease EME1